MNIYPCSQVTCVYGGRYCKTKAQEEELCRKHGGHLAYRIFNNESMNSRCNDFILDNNTKLSLFGGMFLHIEYISAHIEETRYGCKAKLNILKRDYYQLWNFGINNSALCALKKRTLCYKVLTLTSHNIYSLRTLTHDKVYNKPYPFWSVVRQLTFKCRSWTPNYIDMTLCEKSGLHDEIFTNCSSLYMACSDGTCVHDSLVCDGHPHCMHGEDEADCQHICSDHSDHSSCMYHCHHRDLCSCSSDYFQCLSGGCVLLQKLCDKTPHCADASDEPPTCVYMRPEQLGNSSLTLYVNSYINKLIQETMDIQQECSYHNEPLLNSVEYVMHGHQPNCSPSSHSEMKFPCSVCDIRAI